MKTVSVRLEDDVKEALEKKAKSQDLSISQVLRKFINDYINGSTASNADEVLIQLLQERKSIPVEYIKN